MRKFLFNLSDAHMRQISAAGIQAHIYLAHNDLRNTIYYREMKRNGTGLLENLTISNTWIKPNRLPKEAQ